MPVGPSCTRARALQSAPSRRSTMAGVVRAMSSAHSAQQRERPSRVPIRGAALCTGWISWSGWRRVEDWVPGEVERVYAILDNLNSHRATDVLLFLLAHPRWEMVFQPKYAAYLNLIEPWWKILRSLALSGRRFDTWEDVTDAIRQSTAYWNAHRHPSVWGKRRRHRPRRRPGIALLPRAA